jgi:hypothetical protein
VSQPVRRFDVRPLVRWFIFLAAAVTCTSAGAATRASVTLTYARKDAATTSCPDEATFRGLVAARLGYDPFATGGSLALTVEFRPRGSEMIGHLSLTGEQHESRGERTMRSDDNDCFELAASIALATAVAVDPEAVQTRRAPPAPPPTTPPPIAPPSAPPSIPPLRPIAIDTPIAKARPSELGLRLDAGGTIAVGILPATRGGLRLGAAIDAGLWSIGVEGGAFFSGSRTSPFGTVSAYVLDGSLVPCLHHELARAFFLDSCAVGSLGGMFSHASQVTRSRSTTDLFAAIGPRAGLTVMPWPALGFAAAFDLLFSLSRVHLVIDDMGESHQVWASSTVGVAGGVSVVLRPR